MVKATLALGVTAMLLVSCGSGSKQITPQEVIAELQEEIRVPVSLDPRRESAEHSVLSPDDATSGVFSIFVFDEGTQPTDFNLGEDRPVPAVGEVKWSAYEPFGSDLPGEGSYDVLKTYGPNLVLLYVLSGKPNSAYDLGHTPLPGSLILLDQTLASMTGTEVGIAPNQQWLQR